jgi:acyl phosphate:glycerol-3-phosphate acyltransferase
MPISMSSLSVLLAYFLGAIPFGLIIGRLSGVDILNHGSGNIGATNVQRVLGTDKGLAVLGLDVIKGMLAVVLAQFASMGISTIYPTLAALAAVLGHSYSVFLRFRGGRSVSVALGAFLLLAPQAIGIALGVFLLTTFITRFVSLGSILAALAFFLTVAARFFFFHRGDLPMCIVCLLVAFLIIIRHRANIARLLHGEERRFSFSRKGKA